jgi:hypothetical protein
MMADLRKTRPTVVDLKQRTRTFLARHWDPGRLGAAPSWSKPWRFQGSIPNHDLPGCYALLQGDEVVYIGAGAGKGKLRYIGHGLGSRLQNYFARDFTVKATDLGGWQYRPTARAPGITAVATIGFGVRYWYMAHALEAFLIDRLHPARNAVGKRWPKAIGGV